MAQLFGKAKSKPSAEDGKGDAYKKKSSAATQLSEATPDTVDSLAEAGLGPEDFPELSNLEINRQYYESLFKLPLNHRILSVDRKVELDALNTKFAVNNDFRTQATPRLPAVIPQLMQCLNNKDSSTDDFVKLIQQDASVSAAVLKTANSPLFNPANKEIDSFQRAVVIVGTKGLRSLLCTSMLQPITADKKASKHGFGKHLWSHALRTGITTQILTSHSDSDPFTGYLAGLFNNIGELTIFSELNNWNFTNETEAAHAFYYLQQRCGHSLSASIIKQWQIPGDIDRIVMQQGESDIDPLLHKAVAFSQAMHLHHIEKLSLEDLDIFMQLHDLPGDTHEQVQALTQQMQGNV